MYSIYLLIFTAFATLINSSEFTKWLTSIEQWEEFCCVIDQDCVANFNISDNTTSDDSESGNGF